MRTVNLPTGMARGLACLSVGSAIEIAHWDSSNEPRFNRGKGLSNDKLRSCTRFTHRTTYAGCKCASHSGNPGIGSGSTTGFIEKCRSQGESAGMDRSGSALGSDCQSQSDDAALLESTGTGTPRCKGLPRHRRLSYRANRDPAMEAILSYISERKRI